MPSIGIILNHNLRLYVFSKLQSTYVAHIFSPHQRMVYTHMKSSTFRKPLKGVITIDEADARLPEVADLVANGGVIALPTDTVYGVACSSQITTALNRLYEIKGRDTSKPMAVCVDQVSHIHQICDTSELPTNLLASLLPGPVTVLLPRCNVSNPSFGLNPLLNPECHRVGVRIPEAGFIQRLVSTLSLALVEDHTNEPRVIPLVLTSANISGKSSALSVWEFEDMWSSLDLIIDGGKIGVDHHDELDGLLRSGSTIIDLSFGKGYYNVTREGSALEATISILEGKFHMKRRVNCDM